MSPRVLALGLTAVTLFACMEPVSSSSSSSSSKVALGDDCTSNADCESGCCYPAETMHPFCDSTYERCMGDSSGSSGSSSSGSTSSSGGSSGSTSSATYVEFMGDPEFVFAPGSGSGQVVMSIEAEGRSFQPKSLVGGAGKCLEKIRFQGELVEYTLHVRHYGSLDASMQGLEYTNEEYKSSFRLSSMEPGCNTLVIAKSALGLRLVPHNQ